MTELHNTPTAEFPYQLHERIGQGSMGEVFRAREVGLDRQVAIKFLNPRLLEDHTPDVAAEMRLRFQQEARATANLAHPGIVTIHRVGEHSDVPFIAMEWLDGRSLDQVVDSNGPLGVAEVVRIGGDLLEALEAAHQSGIIHRDIKPANLMLLATGRLKVTDFGIAHVQGSELVKTRAGVVLGTLLYASPEQSRGDLVDRRTDLYSTAMVLYALLTGQPPFAEQSLVDLVNSILWTVPPSVHEVNPSVPAELGAVLATALAKDPADRFASAAEMAAALRSESGHGNRWHRDQGN